MGRETAAQRLGAAVETEATALLRSLGWNVLGRNIRAGRGELDIVAVDRGPPAMLVFVEVRHRGIRDFGLPEESLDRSKRAALRRAITRLLADGALPDGTVLPHLPIRVDLVCSEPAAGTASRLRHHRGIALDRGP